jgi:hypothetical protein
MTNFPTNKTILITFFVIVSWFGFKFINNANDLFFQLNYNWDKEETLKEYGNATVDSINYNYISINTTSKLQPNPKNTYKLYNDNDSYYFRYTYSIIKETNNKFYGVEWITDIPNSEISSYVFEEINLDLNQKGGVSTITIGDNYLLKNEAKYFRKFLAKQENIFFKGKSKDIFNYPHEAIKNNTSKKIIDQLECIDFADNYILFFGSADKAMSFDEIKKNLEVIIGKLENAKKIVFITLPPSTIKDIDDFNKNYNKVIKEIAEKSSIKIVDSYTLFKDDVQKYIRKDGISLSKDAYYLLAKKVSENLI